MALHPAGFPPRLVVDQTHDVYAWDALRYLDYGIDEEGENHDEIDIPDGADFTSMQVNPSGPEEIAVYMTEGAVADDVEHAFVVLHGKLRNGNDYFDMLSEVIDSAREEGMAGADRNTLIVAPQFFSTVYNSGQYGDKQLAWGDLNAWQAGSRATHPPGTGLSAMDALDGIVANLTDINVYPRLTNLTMVGHGGGGQLAQRYASVASDAPPHVHVRYIHGDASSCVYFTEDRPLLDESGGEPTNATCDTFNLWRYGFDGFPGTRAEAAQRAEAYFARYARRDVVSLVGYQDTASSGDESCMARMQGGEKRRDRNLVWYRYVHELARTGQALDGFPGRFDNLPDWGGLVRNEVRLRLIVVDDADHDAELVFESSPGLSALFDDVVESVLLSDEGGEGKGPEDDDDDDDDDGGGDGRENGDNDGEVEGESRENDDNDGEVEGESRENGDNDGEVEGGRGQRGRAKPRRLHSGEDDVGEEQ